MHIVANSKRTLTGITSLGLSPGEFYQHLTSGLIKGIFSKQAVYDLAHKLIALAEHAYSLRQTDIVREVSQLLLHLPLDSAYKSLGNYYHALCVYRSGNYADARYQLEQVLERVPKEFRGRVLISISATYYHSNDLSSFLKVCFEAGRAGHFARDLKSIVMAGRNLSLYQSLKGDHRSAVSLLETAFPLVRAVREPYFYYEHLNSFAVELSEVGRLEEAQNVCRITLASPFVFAYPEWRETWQELALRGYKSRSSVPVIQSFLAPKKAKNVLRLPERERPESTRRSPFFQPSDVTSLEDWKNKMVKEPNGENEDIKNMDEKDLFLKLMQLSTQDDITRKKLLKLVEYAIKVTSEPD
jgi:tetratricopeptide (TPR) repeat protein